MVGQLKGQAYITCRLIDKTKAIGFNQSHAGSVSRFDHSMCVQRQPAHVDDVVESIQRIDLVVPSL
jgi:hypothetical protein